MRRKLQPNEFRFEYCESYDVPRSILVRENDVAVWLDSPFDDEIGDFEDYYVVTLSPLPPELTFMEHARTDKKAWSALGTIKLADMKLEWPRVKILTSPDLRRIMDEIPAK